jgi:hypothetical protein
VSNDEIWLRAIFSNLLQEVFGQLGQLQLLDAQHFELEFHLLAAKVGVRCVLAQRYFGRALVAFFGAIHQLGEAFQARVAEAQIRP